MYDDVRNARDPGGTPTQPPQPSEYHFHHDWEGAGKLSTTVVHVLADVMGADVTDAGFVLFDCVNPDALDALFAQTRAGAARSQGHVAFAVDGYRVTVYSSGRIVITPPPTHK